VVAYEHFGRCKRTELTALDSERAAESLILQIPAGLPSSGHNHEDVANLVTIELFLDRF
jgi:hypothetical protein